MEGYVRTLRAIAITFERPDSTTHVHISVETGDIGYFGVYKDKEEDSSPSYNSSINVRLCNWMLDNNLLSIVMKEHEG